MSNELLNYHIKDGEPCGDGATLDEIADYYGDVLSNAPRWISVEDRLPNPNGDWVLVYANEAINCIGYDETNGFSDWNFSPCNGVDISRISHWMPLPKRPEGEDDD